MSPGGVFAITKPINGKPAIGGERRHGRLRREVAPSRPTRGMPRASRTAAPRAKTRRACASDGMYLAYLRDPDGNKLCALLRAG